ncbi:MAG: hypothetical protein KC591_14155 [Gemmatimonadetes bacterium]|nr:hypothetical protein [Gemmatimonadota bacterium]
MLALFILSDWNQSIAGYDLIVCGDNYDPAAIRDRPDCKPGAILLAYVNSRAVLAEPWGDDTPNARISNRLARPEWMYPGSGEGFVPGRKFGGTRRFFSYHPWPKVPNDARRHSWDLRPSLNRVEEHALALVHELTPGWSGIYGDEFLPPPPYLANRYAAAGVPEWSFENRERMQIRYRHALEVFAENIRRLMPDWLIIGNTGGQMTTGALDGISIEAGWQKTKSPTGTLSDAEVAQLFAKQNGETLAARNRGAISIDWSGGLEWSTPTVCRGTNLASAEV